MMSNKKVRVVEDPAEANWKCKNCGVFVQFKAPVNNLAALPPGLGKCPACKQVGSLIRYDSLHPDDDEPISRPLSKTVDGVTFESLDDEMPGDDILEPLAEHIKRLQTPETGITCPECGHDLSHHQSTLGCLVKIDGKLCGCTRRVAIVEALASAFAVEDKLESLGESDDDEDEDETIDPVDAYEWNSPPEMDNSDYYLRDQEMKAEDAANAEPPDPPMDEDD
jgi:ssDNA-binding Zn-finger/Zn-ribbon topoisomerase 1